MHYSQLRYSQAVGVTFLLVVPSSCVNDFHIGMPRPPLGLDSYNLHRSSPSFSSSSARTRGASYLIRPILYHSPSSCSPLLSLLQFLDRPRLHSQSTPASINPIRTYMRNPMITLPSKYPTSWVQRCWYSLFGKCEDVGAAIYLSWTHMRFLFISKTFCSMAAAHNAYAP